MHPGRPSTIVSPEILASFGNMGKWFFLPDSPYRNEWWRYLITIALVFSGMLGFGALPLQIAAARKGVSMDDLQNMGTDDFYAIFTRNELLTYQMFPFVIGFFLLLVSFRFNHRRSVHVFFSRRGKIDFKRFGVAFLVAAGIQTLLLSIDLLSGNTTLHWNFKPESFALLLAICVFFVPLQTGFEELLCRGYILKWTGKATSRGLAVILINGLVFGALHSFNVEIIRLGWFAMLFYVCSGIFAALITVMDDGIELSWGFHTANNFMGLLIVSSEWQSLPTDALFLDKSQPDITWGLLITLIVSYPLMVFILARIYRWKNWKKRLFG